MNRLSIRIIHTGMVDQRCAFASESAPAGFPKAAVSAWEANDGFVRIADIYVFSFEGPLCSLSFESERYRPQAYHGDDIAF
jgi:hypothetical protein